MDHSKIIFPFRVKRARIILCFIFVVVVIVLGFKSIIQITKKSCKIIDIICSNHLQVHHLHTNEHICNDCLCTFDINERIIIHFNYKIKHFQDWGIKMIQNNMTALIKTKYHKWFFFLLFCFLGGIIYIWYSIVLLYKELKAEEEANTGVQMAYVDESPAQLQNLPPYSVMISDK